MTRSFIQLSDLKQCALNWICCAVNWVLFCVLRWCVLLTSRTWSRASCVCRGLRRRASWTWRVPRPPCETATAWQGVGRATVAPAVDRAAQVSDDHLHTPVGQHHTWRCLFPASLCDALKSSVKNLQHTGVLAVISNLLPCVACPVCG